MASSCANGSAVLASNQYQLTIAQYAKQGLTISQPSPTTVTISGLSESQLLEFQLYSYIYSANFNACLTLSSVMVTYTPLSDYVSVPALTCMLQEAIVMTNSSNATMGSIITPFSQPLFNGGKMNVMEITDRLTGLTMTMSPSLGCDKFYILTFSTANRNVGIAGTSRNNSGSASGMARARGAAAAKGVRPSAAGRANPQSTGKNLRNRKIGNLYNVAAYTGCKLTNYNNNGDGGTLYCYKGCHTSGPLHIQGPNRNGSTCTFVSTIF